MSHVAHVSLIRNKRVVHFTDRWMGARVLDALIAGPDQCDVLVAALTSSTHVSLEAEAGWLADFDEQRLIAFGDVETTYVGDDAPLKRSRDELEITIAEKWRGFSIRWVANARALQQYAASSSFASDSTLDESANDMQLHNLQEEEEALGDMSVKRDTARASWVVVLLFVFVVTAGLATRVLTFPFRTFLQSRAAQKTRAFRAECDRKIRALTTLLNANPTQVASRFERAGLQLAMLRVREAHADYDACVRYFEADDRGDEAPGLALALHNRGVTRKRLGYPKLGTADQLRASALGLAPARVSDTDRLWLPLYFAFRQVAGLNPRDDE